MVTEASESYREDSDVLKEFIDERCVVDASEHAAASDLWNEYLSWANSNRERTLDRKTFSQKMQMRNFKKIRLGRDRTWTWSCSSRKQTSLNSRRSSRVATSQRSADA
jgi:phage/plasmid-associated DNA primase